MRLSILSAVVLCGISTQVLAAETQPPAAVTTPPASLSQIPGMTPPKTGTQPTGLETMPDKSKISYAIGVQIGQGIKMRGIDVDIDRMLQGIKDGYSGKKLQMNELEIKKTLENYQKSMTEKMMRQFTADKDKNKNLGQEFLENNKKQPGVITLADGLQYKILKEGEGVQPSEKDTIVVHYQGTTLDGKEFDSSYKRGEPMTAQLSYMIPGWIEVLKLMKTGSTWMLYVPATLAYGERGAPPVIGPNQTLIFKVELLEVKKG